MSDRPADVRVLHVDDDPDFAEVAATYLEREADGLSVETARDAESGLARLVAGDFDCVVSDYDMPGENGIDFLLAVRERSPELPFILFTGKGSEEVASEAISAGVTDYMQKQFRPEQYQILANRIVNVVEQYRARARVERSEQRLREIVDALPHLLFVVDEDGTYLLANEALAAFHDSTVAEIEGAHVREVLEEPESRRFLEDLEEVVESGTGKRVQDVEVTDSTGQRRVLSPRLRPYQFADANTPAVLGYAVDVTDGE